MKRRVLLARALVDEPDILLLDEPTNHLDIEAIRWLEDFLLRYGGTLIFVTHDRMFLGRLATRIVELDRGHLYDWACDYPTFLKRKEELLAAEARQAALFDKKLAQEEVWIRKGIEARRTRNEGRVRALKAMREARRAAPRAPGLGADAGAGGRAVRHHGHRGQGGGLRLRGPPGDPGPDHDHHARGQGRDHRPQRLGQDDPAPPPARPGPAARGDGPPRDQPRGRLLRPAQGHARRGEDGPAERERIRDDRHQRPAPARHRLPPGLPLPARAVAEPGEGPLRRRAEPALAGQALHPALERAGPRRADQRPRHRDAGAPGEPAGGLPGDRAAGQPRPGLPQRRGDEHPGDRRRAGRSRSTTAATTITSASASRRPRPRRRPRPPRRRRRPRGRSGLAS